MTYNKNDQNFSKIFLELITLSVEFKTSFQALAPEMYADIESASTNPNCSCRYRVESYVNSNGDKCSEFLNNQSEEIKSLINLQEIEEKYRITVYTGLVERVKKSEWSAFSQKLTDIRAVWRQFSISEVDAETVDVYFL
jgi:hypothetical protein